MDISYPDQFKPLYDFKSNTEDFSYGMYPFKKSDVRAVDKLLEDVGCRDEVRTDADWFAFEKVLKFFCDRWPEEWNDFRNSIVTIRSSRKQGGYSESKEIKYVGALPPRLERLIRALFPHQPFDKEFVNKLVKKIKIFKVGGEGN